VASRLAGLVRLVGLVGLVDVLWRNFHQSPSRRPDLRERLQWPVRVHLCDRHQVRRLIAAKAASGAPGAGAPARAVASKLAAAFLSLSVSAAASRALLRASCCPSGFRPGFGICRAQASWTRRFSLSDC
jgi:hypothetical protein